MLILLETENDTLITLAEKCGNMLIDNPGRRVSLELTSLGLNARFADCVNMMSHLELAGMVLNGGVVNIWDSVRWFSATSPSFQVFFFALKNHFEDGMKINLCYLF